MAIITRTFFEKSNTIARNNRANNSLSPILELNYGDMLSRFIIYFDHNKVKKLVEDKTYPDISKLKHTLRLTNAASFDMLPYKECLNCEYTGPRQRAVSFDLIFFLVPQYWDNGRGFDLVQDLDTKYHRAFDVNASNWFNATNACEWDNPGIYSIDDLSVEFDKFTSKKGNLSSIIIGKQHFDFGNEPIEFDITETFNKFITGKLENYGIGVAFAPRYEYMKPDKTQYVGFFGPHTNTFYEPFIETRYDDTINDDRESFYKERVNKLYFYASVGGSYVNLDELPICSIEGSKIEAEQATKGVYYVEVDGKHFEPDTMYYDTWSNLKYNGREIPDVELAFTPKFGDNHFTFGLPVKKEETRYVPNLYGIMQDEKILQGDKRKINVDLNIPYTTLQGRDVEKLQYRIFVKEDNKETTVIDYTDIEQGYIENYFFIKTDEMVPARYYIDIRIEQNMELIYHHEMLEFEIIGEKKEHYI